MMGDINWARVDKELERAEHRMLWRPYGLPEITDPEHSAYFAEAVQPAWDVPDVIAIQAAITGALYTKKSNPDQPVTPEDILKEAKGCVDEGASAIHLHVRDEAGYNTLSVEKFRQVIDPLRAHSPSIAIDGCLVAALPGEWAKMCRALDENILDGVPINTAAVYLGDALFAKPLPVILKKTRLAIEAGAKPIVACYTDGDISNADRFLFKSGLLQQGANWLMLPAIPGCSPMNSPREMIETTLRLTNAIYSVDPEAKITMCAAGRASSYLVTVAATLGLHIRVGMEDTVWRWPHRSERLSSNIDAVRSAVSMAGLLGRDVANPEQYRTIMGLPLEVSQ